MVHKHDPCKPTGSEGSKREGKSLVEGITKANEPTKKERRVAYPKMSSRPAVNTSSLPPKLYPVPHEIKTIHMITHFSSTSFTPAA